MKEVHAAVFCESALRALDGLFFDLAVELGYEPGPIERPVFEGPPISFEDGATGDRLVSIMDRARGQGIIMGQTPDRKAYIRMIMDE